MKSDSTSGVSTGTSAAATSSTPSSAAPVTKETEPSAEIEYISVSLDTLMTDLRENALKAQESYNGKYLEVTGRLSVIDSSGKYISLLDSNEFVIVGIQCFMKNSDQKNQVANMSIGDTVTLRGKCKSVGEVLGYSLDIDSIVDNR